MNNISFGDYAPIMNSGFEYAGVIWNANKPFFLMILGFILIVLLISFFTGGEVEDGYEDFSDSE